MRAEINFLQKAWAHFNRNFRIYCTRCCSDVNHLRSSHLYYFPWTEWISIQYDSDEEQRKWKQKKSTTKHTHTHENGIKKNSTPIRNHQHINIRAHIWRNFEQLKASESYAMKMAKLKCGFVAHKRTHQLTTSTSTSTLTSSHSIMDHV